MILALLAAWAASAGASSAGAPVQIAIVRETVSATLFTEGEATLVLPDGRRKRLELKGELVLKPREGGLRLADMTLPSETRLEPSTGTVVKVGAHPYRGVLILRLDPGQTVSVIEHIGLERYLEGVLPHEMDPDWPLEALKAQAVVARTFTYANLGKFKHQGFDLTSDTRSQVYRGQSLVNENVRAAVRQTHGEVLGYGGQILRVYYHSCCGGRTEDASSAWGGDPRDTLPPLKGVRDPWCRTSPHMSWTAYFSWQDLMAGISERRMLPGPLSHVKAALRDKAGYIARFAAKAGAQTVELKSYELRQALGAGELKSHKIKRVRLLKKGVEFAGAGSGHGVGLCQWGARRQAEKGRGYEQILRFYFPGAELSEVEP